MYIFLHFITALCIIPYFTGNFYTYSDAAKNLASLHTYGRGGWPPTQVSHPTWPYAS
jgi:hypothetical protein